MQKPSLFDAADNRAMLARIAKLTPNSRGEWGKMNAAQMLVHCQVGLRLASGEMTLKRSLLGVLFGRFARKTLLDPKPWRRNLPTAPEFKIVGAREFEPERETLVALVRRFAERGPDGLTKAPHPFFGALSTEEWDALQWRHLDHHLTQFGC